jgi:DnaJ-class molecular chaperone
VGAATSAVAQNVVQNVFEEIIAMEKEKVTCQNCRGLGIIGTSVGSNHFRGRDYDCDVCHGNGYVEMFSGNGEINFSLEIIGGR